MPEYYFDIETCARGDKPDMANDEIIAITWQAVDNHTGLPRSPLRILKAWESSEEEILRQFYPVFDPDYPWSFVPVGNNLSFDFTSLIYRYRKYGREIKAWKLFNERPNVDIKSLLVMCNGGSFKGCGLNNFTRKAHSGEKILEWYDAGDYGAIEEYIRNETEAFLELYQHLLKTMPELWKGFAREIGLEIPGESQKQQEESNDQD